MKTDFFKQYLRDNKQRLKGCSLSVTYKGKKTWFKSLNEFGNYLLSILTPESYCVVSNDFGNAFHIFDSEPNPVNKKLSEKEIYEGVYKTLKRWGTTE